MSTELHAGQKQNPDTLLRGSADLGRLSSADLLVLLAVGGVPLPRGHDGCSCRDNSGNPPEVLLLQGLALAEVCRHDVQLSACSPGQAALQCSMAILSETVLMRIGKTKCTLLLDCRCHLRLASHCPLVNVITKI